MKTRSRRGGFSLIELLTVIAIIAILAAIIFPVMGMVKRKAQENNCLANLHQVYMALDMYKRDNRRYPAQLVAVVAGQPMENAKGKILYPEYAKSIKIFHCPTSKVTNTGELFTYSPQPYDPSVPTDKWLWAYAYNSYDCFVTGIADEATHVYATGERQYAPDWAPTVQWVIDNSSVLKPDQTASGSTDALAQQDYERQLKFRNPPGDTVVTWCMWHADVGYTGRAQVVFADGSTGSFDARIVHDCKWRTRPKKD